MKTVKWKVYRDLLIASIGIVGLIVPIVMIGVGVVKCFTQYGIVWGSILSSAGIVLMVLFSVLMYLFLPIIKYYQKMLTFNISIDENSVLLNFKTKKIHISIVDLQGILRYDRSVTFVWKSNQNINGVKTFHLRMESFSKKDFENFVKELSIFECFSDNAEKNRSFSKKNGLNHIFRKNKLELEL